MKSFDVRVSMVSKKCSESDSGRVCVMCLLMYGARSLLAKYDALRSPTRIQREDDDTCVSDEELPPQPVLMRAAEESARMRIREAESV